MHKSADLEGRRTARLALLDRQLRCRAQAPAGRHRRRSCCRWRPGAAIPDDAPMHAVETKEVERRGVELVLATERALGRTPGRAGVQQPGFDVLSDATARIRSGHRGQGPHRRRRGLLRHPQRGADGAQQRPRYRLALVRVDPRGPSTTRSATSRTRSRLRRRDFDATGHRGNGTRPGARAGAVLSSMTTDRGLRRERHRSASSSRSRCRWRRSTASRRARSRSATGTRRRCTCGGRAARSPPPRGALRPARRRPVVASRAVPDRGGAGAERERLLRHHRASSSCGRTRRNETVLAEAARQRSWRRPAATRRRSSTRSPAAASIPLEAQRLGLEAHACDLNPVAVLINKALIEIPPKFAGQPPVFPALANGRHRRAWKGATGLAADVRCYGEWMRDEAERRIGHLYPKATARRRRRGDRHRLDLGADGDVPEPGLCEPRCRWCARSRCRRRRAKSLGRAGGGPTPPVSRCQFEVRTGRGTLPEAPGDRLAAEARIIRCLVCGTRWRSRRATSSPKGAPGRM